MIFRDTKERVSKQSKAPMQVEVAEHLTSKPSPVKATQPLLAQVTEAPVQIQVAEPRIPFSATPTQIKSPVSHISVEATQSVVPNPVSWTPIEVIASPPHIPVEASHISPTIPCQCKPASLPQ